MRIFLADESVDINGRNVKTGARSTSSFTISGLTPAEAGVISEVLTRKQVLALAAACDCNGLEALTAASFRTYGPSPQKKDPSLRRIFYWAIRPEVKVAEQDIRDILAAALK